MSAFEGGYDAAKKSAPPRRATERRAPASPARSL